MSGSYSQCYAIGKKIIKLRQLIPYTFGSGLVYISLTLSMTKQKNGLNYVHITSIVAMSLIAICCCVLAVQLFKDNEVDQRETISNSQKSRLPLLLVGVGLLTAFVCMCINLSDRSNGIELDHGFAIAAIAHLLVLPIFLPFLLVYCCCCDVFFTRYNYNNNLGSENYSPTNSFQIRNSVFSRRSVIDYLPPMNMNEQVSNSVINPSFPTYEQASASDSMFSERYDPPPTYEQASASGSVFSRRSINDDPPPTYEQAMGSHVEERNVSNIGMTTQSIIRR